LHADGLGEVLQRIDIAQPLVLHEERDGVAVHAAAEAVIELLGRADGERGRLLGVERAAGDVIRAALFQRYIALDHVDDIDAMDKFLLEGIGDHVRITVRSVAPASAPCTKALRARPSSPCSLYRRNFQKRKPS